MTTKEGGDASTSVDQEQDGNTAIQSSEAETDHQEVNTSTDGNLDAGASSDASEDGKKPAESSPAEGEKEPESLLDAVTKATETESKAEKSPDSEAESEDGDSKSKSEEDTDESDADGSTELSEKEIEALKPKTRKRMEYLSGQVGELRPKADAMDHLVQYVERSGLSTEEVNIGFDIMAKMKSNPFEALQQLRPYVNALMHATGEELPDHLAEQVKQGLVSEDYARSLVASHTREQLSRQAADRASAEAENLRTTQARETAVNEVAETVSNWERQWASTDPDYKRKQSFVQTKIHNELISLRDRGEQPTRDSIVQIAEAAKKAVEDELKGFLPRKQPVNPTPDGQGSAPATREPTSLRDAMAAALNGS